MVETFQPVAAAQEAYNASTSSFRFREFGESPAGGGVLCLAFPGLLQPPNPALTAPKAYRQFAINGTLLGPNTTFTASRAFAAFHEFSVARSPCIDPASAAAAGFIAT